MSQHIGTIYVMPFGLSAECALCEWSHDTTGGREEAEDAIHRHAAIAHPQPIEIYREDPE